MSLVPLRSLGLLILFSIPSSVSAQNVEGGFHLGLGVLGSETPTGSEAAVEFGVWAILWANQRWAVSADWAYLPRDEFTESVANVVVGEENRNRQYVDVTLQFHFLRDLTSSAFLEVGGGSHWNNRDVINPGGLASFLPAGKESTRRGVFTFGGGFRRKLVDHLNWITEAKVHNLGRDQREGLRLFTGLSVSWK